MNLRIRLMSKCTTYVHSMMCRALRWEASQVAYLLMAVLTDQKVRCIHAFDLPPQNQ